MRHEQSITFNNQHYSLAHVQPIKRQVQWQARTGQRVTYDIRITMSDHCYTEGTDQQERIFDPVRYDHSLHITEVIEKLCKKPSTTIKLVERRNYAVFRLSLPSELNNNEQYWVFFHLRQHSKHLQNNRLAVSMHVQSAYPRTAPVITRQHLPFGLALEKLFL